MIDIHTHLHPERLAHAIRRWFNENSDWKLEHPFDPDSVVAALRRYDVERFVFFSYAHKSGIARDINAWLGQTSRSLGGYGLPLLTVHLDDPDYLGDAKRAIEDGCIGLKIHEDVQDLQIDDPRFEAVFREIEKIGGFVLAHMGPVPWNLQRLGAAQRVQKVKVIHPNLNLVLAHMGSPDTYLYFDMMDKTDRLFLDTTMAFSNVKGLGLTLNVEMLEKHADKILFGSDYPNVPYEYDLEPNKLASIGLSERALDLIYDKNARGLLQPFL